MTQEYERLLTLVDMTSGYIWHWKARDKNFHEYFDMALNLILQIDTFPHIC